MNYQPYLFLIIMFNYCARIVTSFLVSSFLGTRCHKLLVIAIRYIA